MKVIILLIILLFINRPCNADIIKLKNGINFEGMVKMQNDGSYLIDGIIFTKEEIVNIEEKELSEDYNNPEGKLTQILLHYKKVGYKDIWYRGILNLFGIKTEIQKQKDIDEKRNKKLRTIKKKKIIYKRIVNKKSINESNNMSKNPFKFLVPINFNKGKIK